MFNWTHVVYEMALGIYTTIFRVLAEILIMVLHGACVMEMAYQSLNHAAGDNVTFPLCEAIYEA